MAAQAGPAVVHVTGLLSMLVVHPGLFVLVTMNAGELTEVTGPMTFGTVSIVGPADRKRVSEGSLVPGRVVGEMAVLAGGGKTGR